MKRIAVAGATGAVGALVVSALHEAGATPVELSRSSGVDLTQGQGLAAALEGCDAVVDVAAVNTKSARVSVDFFTTVTRNLLAAEREAGVGHHVALSIVGVGIATSGYYAGKVAQEALVTSSDGGWSLLRATQFHEFAAQVATRVRALGTHFVPPDVLPADRGAGGRKGAGRDRAGRSPRPHPGPGRPG